MLMYFLSYQRHNGKDVDECYNTIEEIIKRKNFLINELKYNEIEIKISQMYL